MHRVCGRRWRWRLPESERQSCRLCRSRCKEATMSDSSTAPLRSWLAAPLDRDVSEALERLRRAPDVQHVAVMPDVHLAAEVCIGVVVATSHLIYPQAVGGDIGCGMLAVAADVQASALKNPKIAAHLLNELGRAIPARRRNRNAVIPQPAEIGNGPLSHPH